MPMLRTIDRLTRTPLRPQRNGGVDDLPYTIDIDAKQATMTRPSAPRIQPVQVPTSLSDG